MLAFGVIQVVLSQLPSLENITWLSVVAVATSFGYSFIGLGLCIAKWVSHDELRGTLSGASGVPSGDRAWNSLLALGNIAFAYTFADVLIEIQVECCVQLEFSSNIVTNVNTIQFLKLRHQRRGF